MIKRSLLSALVVAGTAVAVTPAFASDGTITFNGAVTANTCTITGGGDQTITLSPVSEKTLAKAGDTAMQTAFQIGLTGCSKGQVGTYFEAGPNVDTSTGNLKNLGAATNVQVQLLNPDDGSQIKPGDAAQVVKYTTIVNDGDAATLNYAARYYATGASAAGDVNTSVTYSLAYK